MAQMIEVLLPDIGDFHDVEVIEILVNAGDRIAAEDPLITLESDKASMEIPAPQAGVVGDVRVALGDKINQGDLLHGDANGVTNIPPEIAAAVADACPEFIAAEEIMLDYVKSSGPKEVRRFDELRNEFQDVVSRLKQRL